MAEDRYLPGMPKKSLVTRVKRQLATYGIRPSVQPKLWLATWQWANSIANSYFRKSWPLPNEIAAQYLLLLFLEMKTNRHLKLPYRAQDRITPFVAERIGHGPFPLLLPAPEEVMNG